MKTDDSRLWPLGYHLTFHTYGSWLPGDDRGWHHRGDGAAHRPPWRPLAGWCAEHLRGDPMFFGRVHRNVVAQAIYDTCAHQAWTLHALAVQRDHVHVVVAATAEADGVMARLKREATVALRAAGLPSTQRVWAKHGSTRTLVTVMRLEYAVRYVLEHPQ